jgi:diguanylate cyclase (GGDEF)-like protein
MGKLLAPPRVLGAAGLHESEREALYRHEVLDLYRQRLRLLGVMALLLLPASAVFYISLVPKLAPQLVVAYGTLLLYTLIMRPLVSRVTSLTSMRLLTLASYAVFAMGASVITAFLSERTSLIYGGHNHLVLSVLLLPFSVWECLVIGVIVVGSLASAGWWSLPTQHLHLYASHLYVLITTTAFVMCIAHFQNLLRRRAFDGAFDLVRSNDKLQTLSFLDTLTGGFNRRYFEKMLEVEVSRAARYRRPLSVMMFDLDNFKPVNDTFGHAAGDEVLRVVWQAATSSLREVDTPARYGGDEFSVILPETDAADAYAIAQRLRECTRILLHERFGPSSLEGKVTLSIGIATTFPGEAISPDRLIDRADERLYEAKRNGKNNIAR